MSYIEAFRVAIRGLTTHKLRSLLTILGIVIGIAAVISLVSLGRGVQASIVSEIAGMGSDTLDVRPGTPYEAMFAPDASISTGSLTLEDAEAIAREVPSVELVVPVVITFTQVSYNGENASGLILGATSEYGELQDLPVAQGSFITRQDVDGNRNVAVLGSRVKDNLVGDADPIGSFVKIGNYKFRVVGVLQSVSGGGFLGEDDMIIVPITTFQSRLSMERTTTGERIIDELLVKVADESQMDLAEEQITQLLRERHRLGEDDDNDFAISSMEQLLSVVGQITGMLTLFLGAIAAISLLVGGIGIMNIMLVSVRERTREIGIRKAIGARQRDVLTQFLFEAGLLSTIGGIAGLILGWLFSLAFSLILSTQGVPVHAVITIDIVLLAIGVAAAIGLFFGIYPAYRAARLHPVEALRYE
ncbi:MAG: ABC transporter permease [Chloroflexota bacterium]|nr:ABC transporter permease [Chloroflexota bacterium]